MTNAEPPIPPQPVPNDDARIALDRRAGYEHLVALRTSSPAPQVQARTPQVFDDAAPIGREAIDDDGEPSVIHENEFRWSIGPNLDLATYSVQNAYGIRRDVAAGIVEPRHIEYAEEIESATKDGDTSVVALVEERFRADRVASLTKLKAEQTALNSRRAVPLKDATARRVTDTDKIKKLFVEHNTLQGVLTALETATAEGGDLFKAPRAVAVKGRLQQKPYAKALKYFRGRRDEARRQPRNRK